MQTEKRENATHVDEPAIGKCVYCVCVVWCHDSQIQCVSVWLIWLCFWFLSALQFLQLPYKKSLQIKVPLIITSLWLCSNYNSVCHFYVFFEIFLQMWLSRLTWFVCSGFFVVHRPAETVCVNNPYKIT